MSDRKLRNAERAWTANPDDPETLPALWLAWLRAGSPTVGALGSVVTRWREEGLAYVSAINAFVEKGEREGFEAAGQEPGDTREDMAEQVLAIVDAANRAGAEASLREHLPPAWGPLLEIIKEAGRTIDPVLLLDDGSILAGVDGTLYTLGRDGTVGSEDDIIKVGRSPDRRLFAIGSEEGVTIHEGWRGPQLSSLAWPTGLEGAPEGYTVSAFNPAWTTELVPLGPRRALLVCHVGHYVLTLDGPERVGASPDLEWVNEDGEAWNPYGDSMDHGCVSPDGRLIVVGSQCKPHRVISSESLKVLSSVGPVFSEYPHHAVFSADGSQLALNSCHFYNGGTAGIPTSRLLSGVEVDDYDHDHPDVVQLEQGSRVYASVVRDDIYVFGDANGYLRAVNTRGEKLWQHFCGSTITRMDISTDGRAIAVGTYAGQIHAIELDCAEPDPWQIGTSSHRERRRWLLWKRAGRPLRW